MTESEQPLSRATVYTHGIIGIPLAVIGYPLAIWIPAHYAGGLGLSLAAVGTILMLARFTDVITDPIMGELSDRWRTRFGRRKPWMVVGAPVMMLGVYKLFMPPDDIALCAKIKTKHKIILDDIFLFVCFVKACMMNS